MAYKTGNLYIAVCLDLSLAAQGNTMEEATEKLDAQIQDFIAEINNEPQYANQLLNRPAPLSLWLKYYWFKFLLAKNGNGNRRNVRFFEEDCHA